MKIITTASYRKKSDKLVKMNSPFSDDPMFQWAYKVNTEASKQKEEARGVEFMSVSADQSEDGTPYVYAGLAAAGSDRIYKWVDISEYYRNNDFQGAVQQVVQEAEQIAKDPQFREIVRQNSESIMNFRSKPNVWEDSAWTGD